jgi:hypothetical protein
VLILWFVNILAKNGIFDIIIIDILLILFKYNIMKRVKMSWFLSKTKVPEKIPKGMQEAILHLKSCKNQWDCLEKAHGIMAQKYHGEHFGTFLKFPKIFESDLEKMWSRSGFMHCHNLNFLMRILLVRSGFFQNDKIENKWTTIWLIFPHQYLRVKLKNGETTEVDVWGAAHGIRLGDHAYGFH